MQLPKQATGWCDGVTNKERGRLRNAQFLYWEWRHYWLCEDLLIDLGASAEECRNNRLH